MSDEETDTLKLFTSAFNAARAAQPEMTIETTVTEAMIKAGINAYCAVDQKTKLSEMVRLVYCAMHAAAPK